MTDQKKLFKNKEIEKTVHNAKEFELQFEKNKSTLFDDMAWIWKERVILPWLYSALLNTNFCSSKAYEKIQTPDQQTTTTLNPKLLTLNKCDHIQFIPVKWSGKK